MNHLIVRLIARFLLPIEKWKYKDICKATRQYIFSSDHEAECLLECLRLTYGFWSPKSIVYSSLVKKFDSDIKTWLQLLIIIEHEMFHHVFRAQKELDLDGVWVRVSDHALERMSYTIKFFDPAWILWNDHGRLHGDIALYSLKTKSGTSYKSKFQSRLGRTRPITPMYTMEKCLDEWLGQPFDAADIMLKWVQYPSIYSDALDLWMDDDLNRSPAASSTNSDAKASEKPYLMHRRKLANYFFTPFIIRVLLLFPEIVARLTDHTDQLTPLNFLNGVHQAQMAADTSVVLWSIDVRQALQMHGGIWYLEAPEFWPSSLPALRTFQIIELKPKDTKRRIHPSHQPFDFLTFGVLRRCVGTLEEHMLKEIRCLTIKRTRRFQQTIQGCHMLNSEYLTGLVKYIEGRLDVLMIGDQQVKLLKCPQVTCFASPIMVERTSDEQLLRCTAQRDSI